MHVTNDATGVMMTAAAAAVDAAAALLIVRNTGFHQHITKKMFAAACLDMIAKAMPTGHGFCNHDKKVLARVKRHMGRDVRKPADMTIRDFYQRVVRMKQ